MAIEDWLYPRPYLDSPPALPDPNRCAVSGAALGDPISSGLGGLGSHLGNALAPLPNGLDILATVELDEHPEIPCTPEQIEAGRNMVEKLGAGSYVSMFILRPVYRAMAALAPPDARPLNNYEKSLQARIAALEADNADLLTRKDEWREIANKNLDFLADECAARDRERAAALARVAELEAKLATFGDPAPADLPKPTLRPDGTLAPQSKPWSPPKSAGDPRRVGG